MHILIVEDEDDIREFLRKGLMLHEVDIEISEANNGMEAVRLLASSPPDAILLDMLMPDMDGWEFLQVMDALETPLPVVILTAVHRDNASLCGIMTTYGNVVAVENKPMALENIANILDDLRRGMERLREL